MGVLDKFLNAMKLNDDDDMEEEGYLDDGDGFEDDYVEERPKRRFLPRKEEEGYDTEEQEDSYQEKEEPVRTARPKQIKTSKVSPIRQKKSSGAMEVCVIKPRSMEDCSEITETLLEGCTIILNMEGIDLDLAQRIIDFSSGSCYAIHGNLQKVSNYIFIVTPSGVDISGDYQEYLSGAFDVPAFGTKF